VDRDFAADRPDQLWVADITYVPTWSGFLYLAVVVDANSRRVVGWSMESHLRTTLVLQALNMALWQRNPESVIHHSDQGTQGGFKWSSQHLEGGACNGDRKETTFVSSWASEDAIPWQAFGGTSGRAAAVLGSDRGRTFQRGRRGGSRGVARRGHTLVSGGRGDAAVASYSIIDTAVGTLPVLCGTRRTCDSPCAGAWRS
jgi:transposase InsO family protein